MLRVVAHKSAAAARQYYSQGLRREDYYSEQQEVPGKWFGKAAERLGISGEVTPEAFAALVENRHPVTGEKLTPRTKADRRVGYDFNFHAPKSLSIVHALTADERIVAAFRSAVAETMGEMEALTTTRVRKGGVQGERVTGNLVWAEFVHFTARPVGGIPDPHLHIHAFTMNATFDEVENRWKAASYLELKENAPYFQAAFQARLSAKIAGLGYGVVRTPNGWEIDGVSRGLIEKFSRRTTQIEEIAKKKGITDSKAKDALGALSREGKRKGAALTELRNEWACRLTDAEKIHIQALGKGLKPQAVLGGMGAGAAMDLAIQKHFATGSVVEVNRLISEALRFGVGGVTAVDAWREFERRKMIVRQIGRKEYCTSLEVLAEEVGLINFVRLGRGRHVALGDYHGRGTEIDQTHLSGEQRAAVRHILETNDQIMAIRGAAGVGKTTMMQSAVSEIERRGIKVFAFAPSATASRETLRGAGFSEAETVAHLLTNTKLQKDVRGQVIWVDEAGLLGIRDLWQIMKIAGPDTRVILTGDTGQHTPVSRGDAFRLLHKFAGLKLVELTKIRRQERAVYRAAVSALSKGDLKTAFSRLDDLGAVHEIENETERYRQLAEEYVTAGRMGSLPLVVSPTHREAEKVTSAIRDARIAAGELKGGKMVKRLHDLQWTEADRQFSENYRPGMFVQFHQNVTGVKRGEILEIVQRDAAGKVFARRSDGREIELPLKFASRFMVYERRDIEIARGERIRITRGGETVNGRRIDNGNVFTVKNFTLGGNIVLTTGAVLDGKLGHFRLGYCETSHASQSKSVKDVLVAQSSDSFIASSREQFYVSVSRGKASVKIYTDDRKGLEEAVVGSSHRKSAIELANLSKSDVSSFMKRPLDAEQWRNHVRSQAAGHKVVDYVGKIVEKRQKGSFLRKGYGMNSIAAERLKAASIADGKVFGAPVTKQESSVSQQSPRPVQATPKPPEKPVGSPEPSRRERVVMRIKSSADKLKAVLSRNGQVAKPPERALPKPNVDLAADHTMRRKKTEADEIQRKVQPKQAPKPPSQRPPPISAPRKTK